jgi:spore coat protein U-like protein
MTLRGQPKGVGLTCLVALGLWTALAAAPARAGGGASCALSATPLVFGQYVPYRSLPADFTATITLICTSSGNAPVPILGSLSLSGAGAPSDRELTDGPARLRYQLFLDPSRTTLWGEGGSGARPISGTVGPAAPFREALTVYGRLLARQSDATVGAYTGQIVAILTY